MRYWRTTGSSSVAMKTGSTYICDISTSGNLAAILDFWYTSMSYDISSTTTKLEVRGRARREAARRRKSEWKVNLGIEMPLAATAGRMKRFSENTSTIPEVMDSNSLNFSQVLSFHD